MYKTIIACCIGLSFGFIFGRYYVADLSRKEDIEHTKKMITINEVTIYALELALKDHKWAQSNNVDLKSEYTVEGLENTIAAKKEEVKLLRLRLNEIDCE